MAIDLKDPRLTFTDEALQPSRPPGGAAYRNGHTAGPQTSPEVDAVLTELHRRDQLLKVVSSSIAAVLTADSVKERLPQAMQQIAEVVSVDRMSLIEERAHSGIPRVPLYVWTAAAAPAVVNWSDIETINESENDANIEWRVPLHQGHAILGSQRTSPPALASYLARLNLFSVLLVPIMIRGTHWGQISFTRFEDCGNEHDWTRDEISTLKLFADVIGVAITRERSMEELIEAQSALVTAARQAGMAEIANNVLHNVGNVLNSVNVSAGLIGGRIRDSKAQGLAKAVQLMNEHATDLGDFLTRDEKGKVLPGYLNKLVSALAVEKQSIAEEFESLTKSIDHIKEIVANQQSYSGATSLVESVQIKDLMEDVLRMNAASMARHHITVIRDFADVPSLRVDKHLVLQILINLIGNAKHAMDGVPDRSHQITLRMQITEPADGPRLRICVEDDGEGIAPENLPRLFVHGFTTRKNGHGFGLHSCALAAKEMGGTMTVHSEGPGKGAAFTLELPANPAKAIP
jgi:signal transduction histidine kinase